MYFFRHNLPFHSCQSNDYLKKINALKIKALTYF